MSSESYQIFVNNIAIVNSKIKKRNLKKFEIKQMKRYEIDHRTANFLGISKADKYTETMYFAVSFNCLSGEYHQAVARGFI